MLVGVLAFHGDFAEHVAMLRELGADVREVRSLPDLEALTHLIIPGGESTVMSRFLQGTGVGEVIRSRALTGFIAMYGTCAGAILLARKVTGKHPPCTLELLDVDIERNAYGTQAQSFETSLRIAGIRDPLTVSFIRAPKITRMGEGIEVLASHQGDPVLVRQGRLLAGMFHPEVRGQKQIHSAFLEM